MSKIKLYLGTELLDYSDSANIKSQVYDLRSPDIGNSNKSYKLKIPLTLKNRKILGNIQQVNIHSEITDTMRLTMDGVELIRGEMETLSITESFLNVIINADSWVKSISGVSIRDLNWQGADEHEFNGANVEDSWTASIGTLYRYPMINFANSWSDSHGATGWILPHDFVCAWNMVKIMERIFLDAGFTIAGSNWCAQTANKNLYILGEETVADSEFLESKKLAVRVGTMLENRASVTHYTAASFTINFDFDPVDFGTETTDEGADYATATDIYTVPETGTYRFKFTAAIDCDHNNSYGYWSVTSQEATMRVYKGATVIASKTISTFDGGPTLCDTGYFYAEAGDEIKCRVDGASSGQYSSSTPKTAFLELTIITDFESVAFSELNKYKGTGLTMSPTTSLPDIDSLEFLKAIKQMANLRFWIDEQNKTVHIVDAPNFVGDTVVDWSDKLDYSDEPEQEFIASGWKKNILFRYKDDDSDQAYTEWVNSGGLPLTKEIVLSSVYAQKGKEVFENLVFTPTATGGYMQIGPINGEFPRIWGSQELEDIYDTPLWRAPKWAPRCLVWEGMSAAAITWNWYENYQDFNDGVYTPYSTYPKMGNFDLSDAYDAHWKGAIHYVDNSRLLKVRLRLSITDVIPFITKVGTVANEGFRATYKLNIEGIDMYFFITKLVFDGEFASVEMIQKM